MRKTITVAKLVEMVNARNACSTCAPELRQGWNSFLEEVLAHTGNYLGFHFLDGSQVPVGTAPGIDRNDCAARVDETRRVYR